MADKKFVCPMCGSKIEYWKEYVITKSQSINPITGNLSSSIKSDKAEQDHMTGLQCTKCTWIVNDVLDSVENLFKEWYEEHEKDIKV